MYILNFNQFLYEAKSIEELSPTKERPMVEGVAEILRGVADKMNRLALARKQVREFKREDINFDYAEFFKLCGLDVDK
jgi:hypothetical protein